MTSRTVKSVTISLPTEMLEELDRVRTREHRSRRGFCVRRSAAM